jgi:hypothetical protein
MKISIITPTRARPNNIERLINSGLDNAHYKNQIEFLFYVDFDDILSINKLDELILLYNCEQIVYLLGPRIIMSDMNNKLYERSKSDILMFCGDDIIFRTKNWDLKVLNEFNRFNDKIIFVHGDDGYWGSKFGTHGFLHKKWVETTGYFLPPYFSSDYCDTWINEVSNLINRRFYIEILTEHMHPNFGKGEFDLNHQERVFRHKRDNVDKIYSSLNMRIKRYMDTIKLSNNIDIKKTFPLILKIIFLEFKINTYRFYSKLFNSL